MRRSYVFIQFLLNRSFLILAERFDSIYSVHTNDVPMCPPDFFADAEYIGCCWNESETITFAPGPDGSLSPGCCWSGDICTGPPPIMYDWIIDPEGDFAPIIPTLPASNPTASATTTSRSPSTSSSAIPSSSETFEPQPTETGPEETAPEGTSTEEAGPEETEPTPTEAPQSGAPLSPGDIVGIVTAGVTVIVAVIGAWKYKVIQRISNRFSGNPYPRPDLESFPSGRQSSVNPQNVDARIEIKVGDHRRW
ncbi:hypothetical protein TWF718_000382 [Orbilia javanica]|uniref:Uncharacterized protein n=1 Tax=Orbilia javanica TaxID=47235 RepID=A0AAN8RFU3_9PEZI